MTDTEDVKKETRAKKAAAEREARDTRRVRKSQIDKDWKIKILVASNPRRPGSKPHAHFEKYQNGTKVRSFLENGGSWLHLSADIERGYVGLEA